jgi:hypothetical protein
LNARTFIKRVGRYAGFTITEGRQTYGVDGGGAVALVVIKCKAKKKLNKISDILQTFFFRIHLTHLGSSSHHPNSHLFHKAPKASPQTAHATNAPSKTKP